jgi:SSS family solute:Na+ symporter
LLVTLLLIYAALLVLLALIIKRREGAQDARMFYVAGGRLSAFTTACSLVATSVGGSSTVVTTALIYKHGLAGLWADLGATIGFVLLGLFLARRVRQSEANSIAELIGQRYGEHFRKLSAWLILLAEIAWLALLTRASAALLAPALPAVAPWQLMAAALFLVVGYTAFGGQLAVAYSDVLQLFVMAIGLLVILPSSAIAALPAGVNPLESFPLSKTLDLSGAVSLALLMGLPHLLGSDIYAKLLAAKDGVAARRATLLASGMKLVFSGAIALVGLAASHALGDLPRPSAALGTFIQARLSATAASVVLVALLATLMSSADQVLLSAVTMVSHDIASAQKLVSQRARLVIASAIAALALLLALALPGVISAMKIAYTLFASGLALPTLAALAFPTRQPSGRFAVLAAAGGALVGGGLDIARLFGHFGGKPVLWGLWVSATFIAWGMARRSD